MTKKVKVFPFFFFFHCPPFSPVIGWWAFNGVCHAVQCHQTINEKAGGANTSLARLRSHTQSSGLPHFLSKIETKNNSRWNVKRHQLSFSFLKVVILFLNDFILFCKESLWFARYFFLEKSFKQTDGQDSAWFSFWGEKDKLFFFLVWVQPLPPPSFSLHTHVCPCREANVREKEDRRVKKGREEGSQWGGLVVVTAVYSGSDLDDDLHRPCAFPNPFRLSRQKKKKRKRKYQHTHSHEKMKEFCVLFFFFFFFVMTKKKI